MESEEEKKTKKEGRVCSRKTESCGEGGRGRLEDKERQTQRGWGGRW